MCTVSVIAIPHGFRLVSNRDEQRTRPEAGSPAWRPLGASAGSELRAIWPADRLRDGREGGTWIGASERGLAMSLLNLNRSSPLPIPPGASSRGDLIPSLLHLNSAHAVAAAVHVMDLSRFPPFRLIAVERPTPEEPPVVVEIRWDRAIVASAWHRPPVCFASSGLGDDLVRVRLPLFEEMVVSGAGSEADPSVVVRAQDAYHSHVWAGREPVSVMMSREDARTVSTTSVSVTRDPWTGRARVAMDYRPIPPDVGVLPRGAALGDPKPGAHVARAGS